jgi:serine/threonine-protein kinase
VEFAQLRQLLAPRYELIRPVGRGGAAVVYLARDTETDSRVAIKILHEEISAALGHSRFDREVRVGSELAHPNIVPIFDSGQVGESLYCVMPFVDGESLRARLDHERQLPIEEAIYIGCEIAAALEFAHRHGIIHRDVKPENVLLSKDRVLVADFGLARAIDDERLTHSGVTVGTPLYMSPEQAAADRDIDGRTDIYSLACLVYEMLAGSPPFTGPSAQVIMARHALDQVPSLFVARDTVPPHVAAAVTRGLAKAPVDRFRHASEFSDALCGKTIVAMPRSSLPPMVVQLEPRRPRRTKTYIGAGAGIALVALLGLQRFWPGAAHARASTTELDPNNVAVTYFEDRTGGRLRYLADGLTEALIERLADVHALRVVSANGVRPFRGGDVGPDSIARALKVGSLVRGSVESLRGDSVRVIVRLVDGASGVDFKSTTLKGAASDALRLRDDLAERAASFLRSRLGEEIELKTQQTETRSNEAWLLVQQAAQADKEAERLAAADSVDAASARFAHADSILVDAERLDPNWAQPAVLQGTLAYRQARLAGDRVKSSHWIANGLAYAERALNLDARNGDALALRGTLRYWRWLQNLESDPRRAELLLRDAEKDLRTAVAISPTNAAAWSALSHLEYQKPDFTEAKLAALRAYQEDAYLAAAPDIVWRLYTTSYDMEDFSGAEQWCAEGQRRFPANPRFVECRLWLMTARSETPTIKRAWTLVDSLQRLVPKEQWELARLSALSAIAGVIARAAQADTVHRASLADSARHVLQRSRPSAEQDPDGELLGNQAFVTTLLGDKTTAFRLLKQYFALNPSHRALFAKGNSWWWRPLMDDARFAELVGFQHR